jgi:hypothetical protein
VKQPTVKGGRRLREAKKNAKRRRLQSLTGESSEGKISRVLRGEINPKGIEEQKPLKRRESARAESARK